MNLIDPSTVELLIALNRYGNLFSQHYFPTKNISKYDSENISEKNALKNFREKIVEKLNSIHLN